MKQLMIDGVPVDVVNDQSAAIIDRHIAMLNKRITDALADLEKANKDKKKSEDDCNDARATVSAKDGEIVVLKKQVADAAVTPEKLDTLVKDRLSVITAAGSILGKTHVYDGKTVETIRREAVTKKLGDATTKVMDDATIVGAFTALTADAKVTDSGNRQFASDVHRSHSNQPILTDAATARDAAFNESQKRLTESWRTSKPAQ